MLLVLLTAVPMVHAGSRLFIVLLIFNGLDTSVQSISSTRCIHSYDFKSSLYYHIVYYESEYIVLAVCFSVDS